MKSSFRKAILAFTESVLNIEVDVNLCVYLHLFLFNRKYKTYYFAKNCVLLS